MTRFQNGIGGNPAVGVEVRYLVAIVEAAIERTEEASCVVETGCLQQRLRNEPKW